MRRTSRLVQVADGKQRARELRLLEAMQEIALVLARIQSLQQHVAPGALLERARSGRWRSSRRPRAMAWSRNALNLISALQSTSGLGVRPARYSARKLANTRSRYSAAKLTASTSMPMRRRGGHRVDQVLARGAVLVVVVVLPVLHEEADHVVARALEQQRGDGGIHASGEADDDLHGDRRTGSWNSSGAEKQKAEPGLRLPCCANDDYFGLGVVLGRSGGRCRRGRSGRGPAGRGRGAVGLRLLGRPSCASASSWLLVSSAFVGLRQSEDLAASAFAGAAGVVVLAVSASGLAGAVAGWASTEKDAEANSTAMRADSFFIFVIIPRVVMVG